jgi:Tol biopolymer transport system component
MRIRHLAPVLLAPCIVAVLLPAAAHASPGPSTGIDSSTVMAWSRFVDLNFSAARIVIANADGTHQRELTHVSNGVVDIDPKISPDGRLVLFERDLADGSTRIMLAKTDGSGERAVRLGCTDPCAADVSPTWGPDGRTIYFTRVSGPFDPVTGNAASAVMYRADITGRNVTRVSQPGIDGVYEDYLATFAPAGYMVFIRTRNTDQHTAVFRTTGTGPQQLTPWALDADEAAVSPASWGPTKDLVVFETYGHGPPDGLSQAVATVSADCAASPCPGSVRYLTSATGRPVQNFNPAWSPSGEQIAFCHFVGSPDGPPSGDIWAMTWPGQNVRAISSSPLFEFRPNWGPAATP